MLVRHLAWQVKENLGGKSIKPEPTSIRYNLTFEVLMAGPDVSKESSRFLQDSSIRQEGKNSVDIKPHAAS